MDFRNYLRMTVAALHQEFLRSAGVFIDSRQAIAGGLFFAINGDRFDGNDFAMRALGQGAYKAVVDRPEFKETHGCMYVPNTITALQRLAHYHRMQFDIPVLALTGSNGKTTTKELVSSVLSQKFRTLSTRGNFNNHLGVPLTLLRLTNQTELAIVEMGANHVGEIKWLCNLANPNHGLITNIGDAHLEGFGSREKIRQGKTELFRYLEAHRGQIFINEEEPSLKSEINRYNGAVGYGLDSLPGQIERIEFAEGSKLQTVQLFSTGSCTIRSNLYGAYNRMNILTAIALGTYFGLSSEQIQTGVESFVPEDNRSQMIRLDEETTLYMDAYNANPTSMEKAIAFFCDFERGDGIAILGDMKELGAGEIEEHGRIINLLKNQPQITRVFLVGPLFQQAFRQKQAGDPGKFELFANVDRAIDRWLNSPPSFNAVILKGSRSIQLEKLAAVIKENFQSSESGVDR